MTKFRTSWGSNDFEYGERQYTAEDPAGHQRTFSETLADVAPEDWGGTSVSSDES
jgi:hypothetical protein